MISNEYCGGCGKELIRDDCAGAFLRLGILKVHWECWSECNLPCSFCYRTRGQALSTADAKRLLSAVKTSGAQIIVFAGGDPSIRPDICLVIDFARTLGLKIEIQTNAHYTSPEFLNALRDSDLVGLSLDGPDPIIHDGFRNKPGNFRRVVELMEFLRGCQTPVILRTVVSKLNYQNISRIADLVERMENIIRWSLLEFSAVGDGYVNRGKYEIERNLFESVAAHIQSHFRGRAHIDVYRADAKIGTYALITPTGLVYGTGNSPIEGIFSVSGSILHDHLGAIADRLPFSRERHLQRYENLG